MATVLGYSVKHNKQRAAFFCQQDFSIGAYSVQAGEPVSVVSNARGTFSVYVQWGEGSIGDLTAQEVNQIAGFQAVQG